LSAACQSGSGSKWVTAGSETGAPAAPPRIASALRLTYNHLSFSVYQE
jgi:hypothetical protein